MIDDFEDRDLELFQGSGLHGAWSANDVQGNALSLNFEPDPDLPGSQTLRLTKTGPSWAPAVIAAPLDDGCPVDARAFDGLRIKARLNGSFRFNLPTLDTTASDAGGRCADRCGVHFGMPIVGLGTRPEEYDIPFRRLSRWELDSSIDFKPSGILGVELTTQSAEYDVWLDELSLVNLDTCEGAATFDDERIDDFEDGDLLNLGTPPGSALGFKASAIDAEKSLCPDCLSIVPDPYGMHDNVASIAQGETLELVLGSSAVGCRGTDASAFLGVELAVRAEGQFKVVFTSLDGASVERTFEGRTQWRTVRMAFGSDIDPSRLDAIDVTQAIDRYYDRDPLLVDDVRFYRGEAPLGAACQDDSDCGGLSCVGPSAPSGGPAGGICSFSCTSTQDCTYVLANTACSARLGFCVETCSPTEPTGTALDPGKCHGRPDMTCRVGGVPPAVDGEGGAPGVTEMTLCQPRCSDDARCGGNLHCEPTTGLCQKARPTGLAQGEPCDPGDADPDAPCAGVCDQVSATCRRPCVLAAPNGCASNGDEDGGLVCLPLFGSSAPGDEGVCAVPCDCGDDCATDDVCISVTLAVPLTHSGVCAARGAPGVELADCANGCPSGELRACHGNGGCLGAQRCRADGSGYAACVCSAPSENAGASGEGGAPSDDLGSSGAGGEAGGERAGNGGRSSTKRDTVRSLGPDCGCSVPRRSGGWGENALLLLLGFVLRRRGLGLRPRLARTRTHVARDRSV
jgi:hypothetical protein